MYPESLRGGRLGGPVAFFDRDYTAVVIMSPLNQFMATKFGVRLFKMVRIPDGSLTFR